MAMYLKGIIKTTFRNLRRNTTSSLIKILGVTISIATVIIIWSFVIHEDKFDKGVPNSNRIFRLETNWASMPPFVGYAINQDLTSKVIATRLNFWGDVGIQVNSNPFNLKDLAFADSTFFETFPLEFVAGNPEDALVLPFSLVLSESLAKRLFGSTDVVGKTIRFENLLFSFALLALFIASIGLFGLSIYSTQRRTKEIGIRKINGASVAEVITMLNKEIVKWVIIAYVLACPIAWYAMHKWLENFAYKTNLSWLIFALAGLLALVIALVTVSWQSWRVATRNPIEALRYE